MRPVSSGPKSRPQASKPGKADRKGGPADTRRELEGPKSFRDFKAQLQAQPEAVWSRFRRAARAMFGEKAFVKAPGEDAKRLVLSQAQLREVAEHPEVLQKHLHRLKEKGAFQGDGGKLGAAEAAALYSRLARAALPPPPEGVLTVATVNDDFTDRKTNLKQVDADVTLLQEAKNSNLRKAVSERTHGVHQVTRSDDRAGSAVVWERDRVDATGRGLALGVKPQGAAMLTRWITWTDMKVDGESVRMVSVHRPPQRFKRLWPDFDRHLAAFVKGHPGKIIIGMDANQRDPRALARATGLKWHAPEGSIDGFLVSPGIGVTNLHRLPKGTSDHHPVVGTFHLEGKKK